MVDPEISEESLGKIRSALIDWGGTKDAVPDRNAKGLTGNKKVWLSSKEGI